MEALKVFRDMKQMQENNAVTILRVIYAKAPISRMDISVETGLSLPTISRIVRELQEQDVIRVKGKQVQLKGRSPVLLELNYDRFFIVGVEILKRRITGVITDLKGQVKNSFFANLASRNKDEVAKILEDLIKNTLESLGLSTQNMLGIGVSVSGLVSTDQKTIVYSESMGWEQVKVESLLPSFLDTTLLVENDANVAVYGESWLGAQNPTSNIIFLSIGSGVGASVVSGGNLLRGEHGIVGEISHLPVVLGGNPCTCGRRGCLEAYVSTDAVERRYRALQGKELDILTGFHKEEEVAVTVMQEVAEILGRLIVSGVLFLNPGAVVLGGLIVEAGEPFLQMVQEAVKGEFYLKDCYLPKICYSSLHPHAGVLGAVSLIINEFFQYTL